jgi:hypothetical protein
VLKVRQLPWQKEITLSEQGNYTAFVAGTKANPSIMVYNDDLSKPSPKFAHIRFANFMAENKGLHLYVKVRALPYFHKRVLLECRLLKLLRQVRTIHL